DGGAGSAARAVAVRVAHGALQGAGGALLRGQPGRVAALACTGGPMDLDVPGQARIYADRDRSARRSTRAPETLPVPLALADRVAPGTDQHAIAGGDGAGIERQDELAPGSPRGAGVPAARVVPRLAVEDPGRSRPGRAVGRAADGALGPVARAVAAHGRRRRPGRALRGTRPGRHVVGIRRDDELV